MGVAVAPAASTPTPTPTSTTTVTPVPTAPPIAGAVAGDTLTSGSACAEGTFSFAGSPLRLESISAIKLVSVSDNQAGDGLSIFYRGVDTYNLIFGFDDVGFITPSDKRTSPTIAFDNFNLGNTFEFELYRNVGAKSLQFVTLAREGSAISMNPDPALTGYTCFHSAGLGFMTLPGSGAATYSGFADGVLVTAGSATRLFGSAAVATIDFAQRTGTLRIDLAGREPAFGEFVGAAATPIGSATAEFRLEPGSNFIAQASLQGPMGATGTVAGQVFSKGKALGLVFELTFPSGERAIGAVGVD